MLEVINFLNSWSGLISMVLSLSTFILVWVRTTRPWKRVLAVVLFDQKGQQVWDNWKELTQQPADQSWPRPVASLCGLLGLGQFLSGSNIKTELFRPDSSFQLAKKDRKVRVEYWVIVVRFRDFFEFSKEQLEKSPRKEFQEQITPVIW